MLSLTASLKNKHIPIQYQIIERKGPKVTELHGDKICDYFYWLEDDSERKDKIIEVEELILNKYIDLNTQKNDWERIRKIFNKSIDYELISDVQYNNWFIFYRCLDFSKSIYKPIFKRVQTLYDDDPHIVFDSNTIAGSVVEYKYSPNGKYCAFTVDEGDPCSFKVIVIDVEKGNVHGNSLQLTKLKKIVWSGDSKGIFVIYNDPDGGNCSNLCYHFIVQHLHDIFIEEIAKTEIHRLSIHVSDDYRYLILGDSRTVSIANIEFLYERIVFKPIFKLSPDVFYEYVGNEGDYFMFFTNDRAPLHRVIGIDIGNGNPKKRFQIVVAENMDNHGVLTTVYKYSVYLFLVYIENLQNTLYMYSLNRRRIEYKIQFKNEKFLSMQIDKIGFFFETQSFKIPRTVYRIDFHQLLYRPPNAKTYSSIRPTLWNASKVLNSNEIRVKIKQDSFKSFDGTRIPMTIIQKITNDDSKKPCMVFAYGGFGCAMLPFFKLCLLLFVEIFNGVVAIFHIRGGSELGDKWLLQPCEAEKCFSDLIAGVEHLKEKSNIECIDKNKIAFHCASHGGLVGTVVMNRRKDLFKSVIIQNANLDLINDLPRKGCIWAKQYGDLTQLEYYNIIKRYSPLLHIRKPTNNDESYPPTLIVASRNDETVDMENSLKYLAHRREIDINNKFQANKPTLLKIVNSGGHHYETAEKPEYIETVFTELKFLAESMELEFDEKYQND